MTDDPKSEAAQLIAAGYRRTSNKYRMVSRIDRPDWLVVLAKELRRSPAEFYAPGEPDPAETWCDYYRRCLSRDTLERVDPDVFKLIPGSGWDPVGYIAAGASR